MARLRGVGTKMRHALLAVWLLLLHIGAGIAGPLMALDFGGTSQQTYTVLRFLTAGRIVQGHETYIVLKLHAAVTFIFDCPASMDHLSMTQLGTEGLLTSPQMYSQLYSALIVAK